MPVRIKSNQCVQKGAVNGASGVVHHIDWPPNTAFTLQPNSTWLASAPPTNIYVDLATWATPTRFPHLPTDWPHTVMPVYQVTASITMQGPHISIKGFPIVPAFGTTVHGVQGETRHAIAVTNLRPPRFAHGDPHAMYVTLSRVTTRRGVHWIGDRPTHDDYNYFRPSSDVLLEDARLKRLSDATVATFQQFSCPQS
jgi:hypothetical protein